MYDFGKRESQVNSARSFKSRIDYNQVILTCSSVNVAYYSYYEAVGGVKSAQMNRGQPPDSKARLDGGVAINKTC
ncbi:MAG: hypothetical protein ACLUKN_06315 [Bacilli bacterium]